MPSTTRLTLTTAQTLFETPSDGYRYELIAGELFMMSPAGGRHGRIAIQVAYLLKEHLKGKALGVVFAAETGFQIQSDPDTVLAPDVAFVSRSKFEAAGSETHYLPVAPELVVEVLSPSDRFSRVESRAFRWLDAGTVLVLVVDPENETVHAVRSRKQIEIFQRSETIDCSDAVSDWQLTVEEVFQLY